MQNKYEQLGQPPSIEHQKNQRENIELRGNKKTLEYSGVPIDIYLSDYHLQIINVQDDARWQADYLIIDPACFDQENPETKGYKGIRKNEPFTLGRENNYSRFNFPETVSRNHIRIELQDGSKISIEDLSSTNGTIITERRKEQSKEGYSAEEESSKKQQDLEKFLNYARQNREKIEQEMKNDRDLAEIIYHSFYSSDVDNLKYDPADPLTEKLKQDYDKKIGLLKEKYLQNKQGNIVPMDNGYWFGCNINGGLRYPVIGRLYLNLKPPCVAKFFTEAVESFKDNEIRGQMKIPLLGDAETFNRFDKMVIYFQANQEDLVLKILEKLYHKNNKMFDETGTPRFTAGIKDTEGNNMAGIGFAEEPLVRNKSFGEIRSQILAEVYQTLIKSDNPNFSPKSCFDKTCLEHHVNPKNPAFNLSQDPTEFTKLKARTD